MIGRAIVVGAGIAGLTAGYRLQQSGFDVTVLESEDHVGGRMSTLRKDGYVFDRGAGTLTSQYVEMMALIHELNIADELITYSDQIGFLRDGEVHRIRTQAPLDAVRTKLMGFRSKLMMLRVIRDSRKMAPRFDPYDLSKLVGHDEETIREYADRRLSPEIRDYVLDPMLRFLYGAELQDFASTELFFIFVKYLGGELMNAKSGIDFLARELATRLDVRLGARVTQVDESPAEVRVSWQDAKGETTESADVCVIALTATQMAEVYPQLGAERREIVDGLKYVPLWKVGVGTDPAPRETATFIQFPSIEVPGLTGVIFEHNKRIGRAPAGKGLLSVYPAPQWCRENVETDDDQVLKELLPQLERIVPGVEGNVDAVNVSRWGLALLVAGAGTWSELSRFHGLTPKSSRVQFAGDYVASSSTNSALISGQRAASLAAERVYSTRRAALS
jgi:oxygen-dependent protoporphyrinogen oxidase